MQKLIFDRTSNDITRAKKLIEKAKKIESLTDVELEEYMNGLKGCYNITDLNRVENAVQYISDLLNSLNYKNEVNTKNWKPGQLFTLDLEMPRYLQNIQNIRNAITIPSNIPQVPNSYKPYSNANIIEKIIYELNNIISYLEQRFIYSGVANLGQSRLWQQRFRTGRTWASQNYMLSQYADEDTIATISSQDNIKEIRTTENLGLADVNVNDRVCDSVNALNESMKKIDDLIGFMPIFVEMTNIISDSSFENDLWNGAVYSDLEKYSGNRSLYFPMGTTYVPNIEIERPIIGHKYYGRRYIKSNGDNQPADCRFEVWGADGANMNWVYAWNNGNHPEWDFGSAIHEIAGVDYPETDRTIIRCFNVATTADTWVDGLMLIDLTATFGIGKEPNLEWCDLNIPYFEGTKTIAVREVE